MNAVEKGRILGRHQELFLLLLKGDAELQQLGFTPEEQRQLAAEKLRLRQLIARMDALPQWRAEEPETTSEASRYSPFQIVNSFLKHLRGASAKSKGYELSPLEEVKVDKSK